MSAAFITLTFYIFLLRERRGAARMGSSTKWAGVWGAAPAPLASPRPPRQMRGSRALAIMKFCEVRIEKRCVADKTLMKAARAVTARERKNPN